MGSPEPYAPLMKEEGLMKRRLSACSSWRSLQQLGARICRRDNNGRSVGEP